MASYYDLCDFQEQARFREIIDGLTRYGRLAPGVLELLGSVESLNDDAINDRHVTISDTYACLRTVADRNPSVGEDH